jgi:signal transduction histidine kinase
MNYGGDVPVLRVYEVVDILILGIVLAGVILGITIPLLVRHYRKRLHEDQNRFVSLASHYLLTPISIIQAAGSRLQEAEALQPGQRERLYDAIVLGERRLWLTVQQLITVNALTIGTLRLNTTKPADVAELVTGAIAQIFPFAQERGVVFKFENLCSTNAQASLDAKYVTMALSAILDNSVKFSPEKAIVTVKLEGGDRGQEYLITIQDSGSGMSNEAVARVGERFYRGTGLYTFDHEGFGLGLYTAQCLIGLHEGSMQVSSKLNKGTVVQVRFPI